METVEKTLRIDELDDTAITVHIKENKGSKRGVALAAHVVHSVDAYVLRTMQRRCSFDSIQVGQIADMIQCELYEASKPTLVDPKLVELVELYKATGIADVRIIDYITDTSIGAVPQPLLKKLVAILDKMLELGSFDLLTVHDCFKSHPNHCDAVRYWYKEICAEIADSNILQCIYSQIVGYEVTFTKAMNGIGKLIRQANYQLS